MQWRDQQYLSHRALIFPTTRISARQIATPGLGGALSFFTMPDKRFRIAFSFTGERREYVAQVAALLAERFGEKQILYDFYHRAEFANPDLAFTLPDLYKKEADLIVVVLCPDYERKQWCRLEWRAIYSIIKEADPKQIMLTRFEYADGKGLFGLGGFIELEETSPEETTALILERLALNEGKEHDHYTKDRSAVSSAAPFIPSNLPGGYLNQIFVGRGKFLEDLRASLLKPTHKTVVNAQGGYGKTHAVVRYADDHRKDYTALLFVPGDTPQKLQSSLAALCTVLHLGTETTLPQSEKERVQLALDWLVTNPGWLLIVDNVDDEETAQALTAHFDQLRHGHVLITSRLHHWPSNVDSLDLSVLSTEDGADLLLLLTDQHRRKAADDDTQARTLATLMEGLPLALHQAAGYINENACTLAQYLTTYKEKEQTIELLGWFNDHSIPYERPDKKAPRPVLITWKTSFDQLTPEARRWLLVFSHYAPEAIPEFLVEAAPDAKEEVKALLRGARQALAQMSKLGLITRFKDEPPRFKIHRLVQEVTRLRASEEERVQALDLGIRLMDVCNPGDPQDVRTWKKWNPLQPHAQALCEHATDESIPERLTWLLGGLSLLLNTKSLYAQAEPLMRRALQIDEASYGPDHHSVARALNNLASLLQDTNRLAEAEPLMARVVTIFESAYGQNHPNVAVALNNLASLLQATNRLAEAEPLMRLALQIDEASFGPDHPKVAIRLNNLAQLLKATNRLADAEPLMRRALQIDEASFGPDHPNVAIRLSNIAQLLKATNRLAEAEPLMTRVVTIFEATYGLNHPNVAAALNNLAQLFKATNRLAEAEPLMRRALQIDEASFGQDHPKVAIRLNNFAMLLQATNRLAEAEPLMRRALQIDEASFGPDHPKVATRLNNLASLLQVTNRLEEAEPLMRRALQIDEASFGPDHPNVARTLNNLATLLKDTNRKAEAEPLMRRAVGIQVRSLGLEHPNSQTLAGNYIGLLQAMKLPEAEIEKRVREAVGGGAGEG